jgi:hypothetical protein
VQVAAGLESAVLTGSLLLALPVAAPAGGGVVLLPVRAAAGAGLPVLRHRDHRSRSRRRPARPVMRAGGIMMIATGLLMVTGIWSHLISQMQSWTAGYTIGTIGV